MQSLWVQAWEPGPEAVAQTEPALSMPWGVVILDRGSAHTLLAYRSDWPYFHATPLVLYAVGRGEGSVLTERFDR